MIWQDQLDSLAERVGEPDLFVSSPLNAEVDTPYFDPQITEQWLYDMSVLLLQETPTQELQAIGSAALSTVTGISGVALPLGTLRVVDGMIDAGDGFVEAEEVPADTYLQMLTVPAGHSGAEIFAIIAGGLQFKGATIKVTTVVEPALSVFQNDQPVLPEGYVEAAIDLAKQLMMADDYMPLGRL